MDKFIIRKSSLKGKVRVSGSKNATLPIMAATLLTDEKCTIRNVPQLMDIRTMAKILEVLGKKVIFENNTLIITRKERRGKSNFTAPYSLVSTMRASFCCLGPLLAKMKRAQVALPGGCAIGVRPVDLHIKGLRELGAKISVKNGYCLASARSLTGKGIYLGGPFGSSVLATGNVLMAATGAKGETVIEYAACEPEVEALACFLKQMGADIEGEGSPLLRIRGVSSLGGAEYEMISDRIEAGTFIAASLATKSPLHIEGAVASHLTSVIETARRMGAHVSVSEKSCFIRPPRVLNPVNITTLPFPGFPTDLQAQFSTCLCFAKGISLITEKIYPDRFMHVAELNRMGASIQRSGPYAIIEGKKDLIGAEVMASDLRASAALVIAGLAAEGTTELQRVYHIDRGYERIENKFRKLGAKIRRVKK